MLVVMAMAMYWGMCCELIPDLLSKRANDGVIIRMLLRRIAKRKHNQLYSSSYRYGVKFHMRSQLQSNPADTQSPLRWFAIEHTEKLSVMTNSILGAIILAERHTYATTLNAAYIIENSTMFD